MANLKALKEQKNTLVTETEELVSQAKAETRSLTDEENETIELRFAEIEALNIEIKETELREIENSEKIKEDEVTTMENTKELEVRGLEQFVRKQDGEELRSLTTTAQGGAIIPENVEGSIILKMEETSPVFAMARKFPSVNGALKIARETATTSAGFVGEGADVAEGTLSLEEVKLNQKRVGASISLSNQLIGDSAVAIVDYSVGLLARRAVKAVEKSMLVGTDAEEFRGIVADVKVPEVAVAGVATVDSLMDLYNTIHPEYLDGAVFVMKRTFFNAVAKLKDGNGHFYMQNGLVNGRLTYTLFGAPVLVTDALTDANPAIFGNIEESYAVMIKRGFTLQHVTGDTTQALRGSQLLVLDGYMDGAVYNTDAIAKMAVTA